MAREDPQLKLRLSEELKEAVTKAARDNNRSVNAEIVERLEESFSTSETGMLLNGVPPGLEARIRAVAAERQHTVGEEVLAALMQAYPPGPSFREFVRDFVEPIDLETDPDKRAEMIAEANAIAAAYLPGVSVSEIDPSAAPLKTLSLKRHGQKEAAKRTTSVSGGPPGLILTGRFGSKPTSESD